MRKTEPKENRSTMIRISAQNRIYIYIIWGYDRDFNNTNCGVAIVLLISENHDINGMMTGDEFFP